MKRLWSWGLGLKASHRGGRVRQAHRAARAGHATDLRKYERGRVRQGSLREQVQPGG